MKVAATDTETFRYEHGLIDEIYNNPVPGMPVRYVLALTNQCNLACPFCFLENDPQGAKMQKEDWFSIAAQLPEYARVIFFGGEPMMYKHFDEVYRHFAERFRCTIVTNGTLLSERKVDVLLSRPSLHEIAVSVDCIGNTNRDFKPVQWDRLVRGIRLFNDRRSRLPESPSLGINTVLLDDTAEGLYDLHRYVHEELGCDHVTYCTLNGSEMQLSDRMAPYGRLFEHEQAPLYEKWDLILEQLEAIRRYNQRNGLRAYFRPKIVDLNSDQSLDRLTILNDPALDFRELGPCKIPWSDCRVFGDGNVTACLGVSFGNFLDNRNLKSILTGSVATKFRNDLLDQGFFEKCKRCVFHYHSCFAV